jgi:oligoendopeptidase F
VASLQDGLVGVATALSPALPGHFKFLFHQLFVGLGLVLALYRLYKDEGDEFVAKYLALLEAGGSQSPEALLKPLSVDIHDAAFWQKGFQEIEALVKRLERLVGT